VSELLGNEYEETAGPETTAAEEARGISLLRQAAKRRDEDKGILYLDVPTWGGDLQGAYNVVDRSRLEVLIRKAQNLSRNGDATNARTRADIDVILEANVGMYSLDPDAPGEEEERRVAIEDEFGVVTWDRFGDILRRIRPEEAPPASAKNSKYAVVLAAMRNNGVAVSAHALYIARWMRDPSKDPAQDL